MEYKLLKINLDKHPISKEDYDTKLYYFTILHTCLSRDNLLNSSVGNLLMSYKRAFDIKDRDYKTIKYFNTELFYTDESGSDIDSIIKYLRKEYPNLMKFKINQKGIKYLLIGDLLYLESNLDIYEHIDKSFIKDVMEFLNITNEESRSLVNLFENLSKKDFIATERILSETKYNSLNYFFEKHQNDFEFNKKYEKTEIRKDNAMKKSIYFISTMSAGKSTLINSLISKEIMPSSNIACTGTVVNYINNSEDKYSIEIVDKRKDIIHRHQDISDEKMILSSVKEYNNNKDVKSINIYGRIPFLSSNANVELVDLPGPNNSNNTLHSEISYNVIEKIEEGLLVYVMDGTSLSSNDSSDILKVISNKLKNDKIKVLFAINKIDYFENMDELYGMLFEARNLIKSCDIKEDDIYPVSSMAALSFSKYLSMNKNTDVSYMAEKGYFRELTYMKKFTENIMLNNKNHDEKLPFYNTGITNLKEAIKNKC